jgi:AraC family ethanolamine operon transcriptional activator
MRLNMARRMWRHGGDQSRQQLPLPGIADIAAQCGYDHPSCFAGDYRRLFGVLPSGTVRAAALRLAESA